MTGFVLEISDTGARQFLEPSGCSIDYHIEQGYGEDISSVTVFAGSGFFNVENHGGNTPESILDCVADSMANLGCITIGQSVVILSPEHAEIVASTGWTKAQVQQYLFGQAKQTVEDMEACGKFVLGFREVERQPVGLSNASEEEYEESQYLWDNEPDLFLGANDFAHVERTGQ